MRMFQPEHIAKNIGTRASWLWTYRNSETCVPRGTSEPVTGSGVYGLQYPITARVESTQTFRLHYGQIIGKYR